MRLSVYGSLVYICICRTTSLLMHVWGVYRFVNIFAYDDAAPLLPPFVGTFYSQDHNSSPRQLISLWRRSEYANFGASIAVWKSFSAAQKWLYRHLYLIMHTWMHTNPQIQTHTHTQSVAHMDKVFRHAGNQLDGLCEVHKCKRVWRD